MIKKIALTNFKGTTDTLNLDQLNIFRGTSGSGKSTYLEGIRVAVLGHDPGYGKLLGETMAFSSGDTMEVLIHDGSVRVGRVFSKDRTGKATQKIFVNGEGMTAKAAEPILAECFGQFPMMLNPDEFFEMSDDKKITFLFGLSSDGADSGYLRRHCMVEILNMYTDAVEFVLEYEFEKADYFMMKEDTFANFLGKVIKKIADKNVEIGRAITKIFSEFLSPTLPGGQETLSMYASTIRTEINATRRAVQDAQAANRKIMEEKAEKMNLVKYDESENRTFIESYREEISTIEKDLHAKDALRGAKERLFSGLDIHQKSIPKFGEKMVELEERIMSKADKKDAVKTMKEMEEIRQGFAKQVFVAETKRLKLEKAYAKTITEHGSITQKNICSVCGEELGCIKCVQVTDADKAKSEKKVKEASKKVQETYDYVGTCLEAFDSNEKDINDLLEALTINEANEQAHGVAKQHLEDILKLVKEEKENLDKIEEPGPDDETVKLLLGELKNKLGERLVTEKNHQWLRTLEATIASSNETINNSDALLAALTTSEKAVKEVRNQLTKSTTGAVEKVCNDLLQKIGEHFWLNYEIEDGKFEVYCVNVSGKSVPFKTLSGGERVLYLSAQLLALMTMVDPKLKILEVEMGELSGNLVPSFMNALKEMTEGTDIQVVLSSCHGDFGVNDPAWKVHQMGE